MKRVLTGVAIAASLSLGFPAIAAEPFEGEMQNVDHLGTLPDTEGAIAVNFLKYDGTGSGRLNVMMVSGTFGLKSYDVNDPANPILLDELPATTFLRPGDPAEYARAFWQNEDMDVDQRRKRVFMARDPRAFDGSTSSPDAVAGVYIIDAADPTNLEMAHFEELPVGHTTTCVNSCNQLWTGGPASNTEQQEIWPAGRPIFVTDVRDLDNVTTSPVAIDTERFDGVTAYAHDVQVDEAGIAWVSGLGGVRGYHTRGRHWDPITKRIRRASATNPIPFAGGGLSEADAPSAFIHNSDRPMGSNRIPGVQRYGFSNGQLILSTEEAFGSNTCDGIGQFVISKLDGSYTGAGWESTPEDPFRLETVSSWSPAGEEGTDTGAPFCSAHYFDRDKEIVAYSWYAQGTRFLDISDPREPIQIAYFRPDDTVSFAPYFYEDLIYVADIARGVDILRLDRGADNASSSRSPVQAPARSVAALAVSAATTARFEQDPTSVLCVVPTSGT
ncbi:MAG: hypothetical protein AB8G26_20715 [Ilumatobacter sp.]